MVLEGEATEVAEPATRLRLRWPVRPLTTVLFLALAGGSCGLALVSRQVVRDQEERLLEQRAAEAAALMSSVADSVQEPFRSLSTVVRLVGPGAFSHSAKAMVSPEGFQTVALLEQQEGDGGYRVVTAEGELGIGAGLPAPASAAALRAPDDGRFVSTPLFDHGDSRRQGLISVVPGVSPRTVIYAESVVGDSDSDEADSGSDIFSDLEGALYVGDEPIASQVVVTSPGFNLEGRTARRLIDFGADQWLMVVSAKEPLAGTLAQRQPWLFLGAGLVASVLVAALVEVLLRRRRYAMALVDERTAALEQSLADLDAAQERLVHQERLAAIGQLASAVGHELRNPLGVISNVIYLLNSRLGDDDPWVGRQLGTAQRELAAATLIVSDLLVYSRPRDPVLRPVELAPLVEEVVAVAAPVEAIRVVRQCSDDLPPVRADRDQLRQVLLNLVTNACDAMPEGGLLIIEATNSDAGIRVVVADTGSGIDENTRSHLFEPFFTTKAKGIGLGLAVVDRIVQAHEGSIIVKSTESGSAFTLTLPAAPADVKVAS